MQRARLIAKDILKAAMKLLRVIKKTEKRQSKVKKKGDAKEETIAQESNQVLWAKEQVLPSTMTRLFNIHLKVHTQYRYCV